MKRCALLSLLLLASSALAQPYPPPPRGHWALDRTGKVAASTLAQLDAICEQVQASGGGQLGVLVIDSTGGQPPRPFATRIFNQWGIGHAGANDGLFLFVALGDRKSEIILGSGSKVSSSSTDVVMRDALVANFKRGQVDAGLLAAARALSALLAPPAVEAKAPKTAEATAAVDEHLMMLVRREASFPEHSPRSWVVDLSSVLSASARAELDVAASDAYAGDKGRVFFLVYEGGGYPAMPQVVDAFRGQVARLSKLPLAVIAWDDRTKQLFMLLPKELRPTPWQVEQLRALHDQLAREVRVDRTRGLVSAGQAVTGILEHGLPERPVAQVLSEGFAQNEGPIFGGSALTLLGGLVFGRRWNRRRTRHCEDCHAPRELLSEAQEDDHLSPGAQTEESLGSVEYDVWWCGRCQDALVLDYTSWFSRYSACPSCHARTRSSTSTTLSQATEYSSGLVQVDEACASCTYRKTYTRTTSRLSSASDSSSFSSSSSSSDSSFGGGSSDGGGSSGSW
jgi:uncharacterized membrane protein YgcG